MRETSGSTGRGGPTLVVGGTGKTGRRVVDRLTARGVPVRVGSRSGEPRFDWEDRATWSSVLRGASSAYVTFAPDLALPGAAEAVGTFAQMAVERGLRRLVLLSGRGEDGAVRAEEALLDDRHVGRTYELTGRRALTFAEAVGEIARASGRPVRYLAISPEAFVAELEAQGVPAGLAALLHELFTQVLDGRNAHLTDGIQRVLGRAPRDFAASARAAAAAGAWGAGR